MKFYLEQIITEKNQEVKDIAEYNSLDAAEIDYHLVMASAILNDNVLYARCRVINEYGMENMIDTWEPSEGEPVKHYLSQVKTKNDGTTTDDLFDYASKDAAISAWHSMLATSMNDSQFTAVLGIVEDRAGNEIKKEYWQRQVEEV